MEFTRRIHVVAFASIMIAMACGQRRGVDGPPGPSGPNNGNVTCTRGEDCRSGICAGGVCADATACTSHGQCPAGQYCHFSSNPLEPQGECDSPCQDDAWCGIVGQQCHNGRCSTNRACNPATKCSCPAGEVCGQQRVCQFVSVVAQCAPGKLCCYFDEHCPCDWLCDGGVCRDPFAVGQGCDTDAECNLVDGCENSTCECFDHVCRIKGECDPCNDAVAECGQGNYCAGTVCREAIACPNDQDECTPYRRVCRDGSCVNPAPCPGGNNACANATACGNGYTCNTDLNPPGCLPDGATQCSFNEQCPAGKYCEILTGKCEPGCRDNHDCVGQCLGAQPGPECANDSMCNASLVCVGEDPLTDQRGTCSTCYCGAAHTCSDQQTGPPGGQCNNDAQCSSGAICAYDNPWGFLTCAIGEGCEKSCRVVCDLLLNLIMNTCPAGQKCGSGNNVIESAVQDYLRKTFGSDASSSATVCYPQ